MLRFMEVCLLYALGARAGAPRLRPHKRKAITDTQPSEEVPPAEAGASWTSVVRRATFPTPSSVTSPSCRAALLQALREARSHRPGVHQEKEEEEEE